jgi:hypothetical protein
MAGLDHKNKVNKYPCRPKPKCEMVEINRLECVDLQVWQEANVVKHNSAVVG